MNKYTLVSLLLNESEQSKLKKQDVIREVSSIPMEIYIGAGAAMVLRGLMKETKDIDAEISEGKFQILWNKVGHPKISIAPSGARYYTVPNTHVDIFQGLSGEYEKYNGLMVETVQSLYAFYKRKNRPKDQKKIEVLKRSSL